MILQRADNGCAADSGCNKCQGAKSPTAESRRGNADTKDDKNRINSHEVCLAATEANKRAEAPRNPSSAGMTTASMNGHCSRTANGEMGDEDEECVFLLCSADSDDGAAGARRRLRRRNSCCNLQECSSASHSPSSSYDIDYRMSNYLRPESKFHCGICLKRYEEPRLLPCLHTFCTKCLDSLEAYNPYGEDGLVVSVNGSASGYESERSSADSTKGKRRTLPKRTGNHVSPQVKLKTVLCPTCDTEVDLPVGEASRLPFNYVLRRQMLQDSPTTEVDVVGCDLCTTNSSAMAHCTHCAIHLCAFCSEAHKRQRTTADHDVVNLQEAKRRGLHTLRGSGGRRNISCPRHPTEELKLFCETCVQTTCRDCVLVEHRDHQCRFVGEVSEKQASLLRTVLGKVKPQSEKVRHGLESLRTAGRKMDAQVGKAAADINRFADLYAQAVEQHRQNLLSHVKRIKESKHRSLQLQRIQLEQALEDLESSCSFTEDLLAHGSQVEILSLIGPVLKRLQELRKIRCHKEPQVNECIVFDRHEKAGHVNGFPMLGIISSQFVSPSHCIVKGEGLRAARHGHKSEVLLISRDADGQPMTKGGEEVRAELVSKENVFKSIPVNIVDRKDGSYILSFCPDNPGLFNLHITIQGSPIQGSPFLIPVKPKWRKHSGVFHCCTFCSSGGSKEARCACGGTMPGGYKGCGHGHKTHPGRKHWSCCGKTIENSECSRMSSVTYQFTL